MSRYIVRHEGIVYVVYDQHSKHNVGSAYYQQELAEKLADSLNLKFDLNTWT